MTKGAVQATKSALLGVLLLAAACGGVSLDVGTTDAGAGGFGAVGGGFTAPGSGPCSKTLPEYPEVICDWRAALGAPGIMGFCFKGGCHNATTKAGELDLTPDSFLASRLLNVPAAHDLTCPGQVECDPERPACEVCSQCPREQLLINTSDLSSSWIFRKLEPFVPGVTTETSSIGCGDAMPTYNTTGTANYRQAHKDCLIEFFTALARTPGNWPCYGP